jgi:hypothetical protein
VVTDTADVGTAVEFLCLGQLRARAEGPNGGPLPVSVGGICTVEVSAGAMQVWTVDVPSG